MTGDGPVAVAGLRLLGVAGRLRPVEAEAGLRDDLIGTMGVGGGSGIKGRTSVSIRGGCGSTRMRDMPVDD